jgi:hypothetical protein
MIPESSAIEHGSLRNAEPYSDSLLGMLSAALWPAHTTACAECRRIGGDGGRAEYRDVLARQRQAVP